MKIKNTDVPVVVLDCNFAGIGIMRSLGSEGVSVYGVDSDSDCESFCSRYCRKHWVQRFDPEQPRAYLDFLMGLGKEIGTPAVLIPTTDAHSIFVAENRDVLRQNFIFTDNDAELVRGLADKVRMTELARQCGVPTPGLEIPRDIHEVLAFAEENTFPVMIKGIRGDRLEARTGTRMVIAHDADELLHWYKELQDPVEPNVMLQEYIPGGDDQVYIFNGYFDKDSRCLAAFTGHKIRQYPIHLGCASLGRCTWNDKVADMTIAFMQKLNYRGILDIGYRLDPRDGSYKVLDANPRIGGAFRLFVDNNGGDVVRALYCDLTGQEVQPGTPREGRKWMIENYDIRSSYAYFREGSLSVGAWLKSLRGIEELKWFSWKDPLPAVRVSFGFGKIALRAMAKRLARPLRKSVLRVVQ